MNPFFILMMIFGICIFLYGLDIYVSKNPIIPRYYKKTISKSYRHYVGSFVMLVSLSPILSGIVSCFGDSNLIVFLSMFTLIASFIILLVVGMKIFKEK